MVAHKRSLFLLKINPEGLAGEYKTIAGLEASKIRLDNQAIDSSNLSSGEWRELQSQTGISAISILANGIFKNSEYEEEVRASAYANSVKDYQLLFHNGDVLEGKFLISNYEKTGSVENEEIYSFVLESAGDITYKKAANV